MSKNAMLSVTAVMLVLFFAPVEASAHRLGESYIFLQIRKNHIEGRIELHTEDADSKFELDQDGDGKVSSDEITAKIDVIRTYVSERFRIGDGTSDYAMTVKDGFTLLQLNIGDFIQLEFSTDSIAQIPNEIDLGYEVFFDHNDSQIGLLVMEVNERLQLRNDDETVSLVFESTEPTQTLDLTKPPRRGTLTRFIWEGVWHIWIGLDHILFLVALLLASVMNRESKPWQPVETFRSGLWNVVKIATIFTVAHSITLGLAATGVLSFPSWIVESIIAVSIIIAAFDNMVPLFGRRIAVIVFLFGLFHGLGFASVLGHLALSQKSLFKTLLGFNVGVELGQIAIICVVFPILFKLRELKAYRPLVLYGGSVVLILLGLNWVIDRSLGITILEI